jgi:outer membrane protein TolC
MAPSGSMLTRRLVLGMASLGAMAVGLLCPNRGAAQIAEQDLAHEVRLETVLRVALAQNPDMAEAGARTRAARELAPAAASLPPLQVSYQLWAAPLARPYALDEAEMHMFGVQQTFPAFGSLSARSEAATAQADVAAQSQHARRLDLVQRVRRAYAEYCRVEGEALIHQEHVTLSRQLVELARAAGRASIRPRAQPAAQRPGRARRRPTLRAGVAQHADGSSGRRTARRTADA